MEGATAFPVLTIGHSNHSLAEFTALLQRHDVAAVADVRTAPYSRYTPHFNHDALRDALEAGGLDYMFLGGELGGRPADRSCYDESGRVLYERVAETDAFDDGIRSVMHVADQGCVALMCSEKEPLDCHRTLLVARALAERGVAVRHILADGSAEDHEAIMDRLVEEDRREGSLGLYPSGDMFRSREDIVADAVARRAGKVAYKTDVAASPLGIRETP
ncbi:MAG: DUF488 domain-containing protein [Chloroflexota bacterium]|nr:DUF488 domain-containing protein [Chloroflexota bacterium]